jgi:hypothetical protein
MYDANDIRLRIASEARRGDWQTVAELAGKSVKTVYAVTGGRRENEEVLGHFVELLNKRRELKAAKGLAVSQEAAQ